MIASIGGGIAPKGVTPTAWRSEGPCQMTERSASNALQDE